MTSRPGATRAPRGRIAVRAVLGVLLAGLAVLAAAPPAAAHATLLSTDPPDGAVLQVSPTVISFTFDETVTLPPDAVQVFDATGKPIKTEVHGHDAVVSADVPDDLPKGTYVVPWRVISADGHPVAGSISFSIGAPSLVVKAPKVEAASDAGLRHLIAVASGVNYLGLFLAGGLVVFLAWVVAGVRLEPVARRRLLVLAWVGAAVTVVSAALLVTATGAQDLGQGFGGVGRGRSLDLRFVGADVLVLCLQATGLASALLFLQDRWAATAAAVLAVVSPALVGHSRATDPVWLVLASDLAHLAAGATWLGGLTGLALALGSLSGRERDSATVLSRFSTIAAGSLGVLAVTGTIAAWRIVGSWAALVHTGYGQLLLVKIGVVALVALVAGGNRFLLLPRVRGGVGHDERRVAVLRVRTAVRCEAALVVAVLGLTGFLVGLSPNQTPTQRKVDASRVVVTAVDKDKVLVTLAPGRVGPNTLTLQVQDQQGEPVELHGAPTASMSNGAVDLGQVTLRPVASGTYAAQVILPQRGVWQVAIGLRVTEFDNPVTTLDVTVS